MVDRLRLVAGATAYLEMDLLLPECASYSHSYQPRGALREQRISGVPGPFSSFKSLTLAFVMCPERP